MKLLSFPIFFFKFTLKKMLRINSMNSMNLHVQELLSKNSQIKNFKFK